GGLLKTVFLNLLMSSWHPCANAIKSWWRAPIKSKKFCAMGQKKRGALLRLSWQKYAPQLVCAQQPWRTYPPPAIQHSKTVRKRHAGLALKKAMPFISAC